MSPTSDFKVIICGGGIAGLCLALCLQKAKIDYVVLEARDEVAPQVGASIGLGANSSRILDQLGAYDQICSKAYPCQHFCYWKDGKLIKMKDYPRLLAARTGYPIIFINRQWALQCLFEGVEDKQRIMVNKRVAKVDHSDKGVTVHCKDGTYFQGDVVVGADGVHSQVRYEMWRAANLAQPGTFSEKEMTKMSAEYTCLFGTSNPCGGEEGQLINSYGHNISALTIIGKHGQVYWFFFNKMNQKCLDPTFPRFTAEDAAKQAERYGDFQITDKIKMADLWKNRVRSSLVPLEEAFFDGWSWGRMICIGDSVHKMTPNLGQGANTAVESAAVVANSLKGLLGHNNPNTDDSKPTLDRVVSTLGSVYEVRKLRAKSIFSISNRITRNESLQGPLSRLLVLYIAPNSGDYFSELFIDHQIGAEKIEYLPNPARTLQGNVLFNKSRGVGKRSSVFLRVLIACPILLNGFYCFRYMHGAIAAVKPHLAPSMMSIVCFFAVPLLGATSHPFRDQLLSFLVDLTPIYLIWVLESHRRMNLLNLARFPLVFGLAFQLLGIGCVAPFYYFFHYVQSPMDKFFSKDRRMHQVNYAKTALPAMLLAYVLPTFTMFFLPSGSARLSWNAGWQLFPLLVTVTHSILAELFVTDTTTHDRLQRGASADLKHVRLALSTCIILAAGTFNYVRFFSSPHHSLAEIFLPSTPLLTNPTALASLVSSKSLDLLSGAWLAMQVDHLACFTATYIWLALLLRDLKSEEMLRAGWIKIVVFAVLGTYMLGPGATAAIGWWVREETLASKPLKGSIVAP